MKQPKGQVQHLIGTYWDTHNNNPHGWNKFSEYIGFAYVDAINRIIKITRITTDLSSGTQYVRVMATRSAKGEFNLCTLTNFKKLVRMHYINKIPMLRGLIEVGE